MDFEFKDYPNFSDKGSQNCTENDPEDRERQQAQDVFQQPVGAMPRRIS